MQRAALVAILAACGGSSGGVPGAVKDARYALIRDTAAQMGVHNAALLAGIAVSETHLAHCWSEAPHACAGPASPSCGGSAVIAGAADGPCAARQGGLGLFQLDAGTYADTVATYGPQILTIEGNTAQAVAFVVGAVEQDVPGVSDWLGAAAWLDEVPLDAASPVMAQWASVMACRYNGCCTPSATCTSRANGYRDNALAAFRAKGADFWRTATRCAALPPGGVIEERSACYVAGGDPRGWHREAAGEGGDLDWTTTTDAQLPGRFGEWRVRTGRAGRYHVEVALDGGAFGQTRAAHYEIAHAGVVDTVDVDQATGRGFVALGDFEFAGSGDEHVRLGDDTGEGGASSVRVAFDAVRVTPAASGGRRGAGGRE